MTDDKGKFKFEIVQNLDDGKLVGAIICSHGFRKITSIEAAKECVRSWNKKREVSK